ncbi:MAG: hypothetical protein OXD49_00285 [Candidatus Poribacteria bacterium]|nr:hypothetical protein [Candidatus Poribacteria bacterium]
MRVLLDEHLPHRLRHLFATPIEVVTVGYKGWKGLKNGELLRKVSVEFDVFITMDKGFLYQQNLEKIQIGIVLLIAESNRYAHLAPLISQVNVVLRTLKKGQVVSVSIEQTATRKN